MFRKRCLTCNCSGLAGSLTVLSDPSVACVCCTGSVGVSVCSDADGHIIGALLRHRPSPATARHTKSHSSDDRCHLVGLSCPHHARTDCTGHSSQSAVEHRQRSADHLQAGLVLHAAGRLPDLPTGSSLPGATGSNVGRIPAHWPDAVERTCAVRSVSRCR